jgi:hypothetical protein
VVLKAIPQVIHQRSFQSVGFMIQNCAARWPLMSSSTASGGSVSS